MIVIYLLCLLIGFLLGKYKQDRLMDEMSVMSINNQALQIRNTSLDSELSRLQVSDTLQQQKIRNLVQSTQQLTAELALTKKKLFFYERVLAPELEVTGVNVHTFEVAKNHLTNEWEYQLVLMQSQKGRRLLKGKFDITLSVFEGDQLKQLKLSKLTKENNRSFQFKYFQTIEGAFLLPENITVDEVTISLSVAGSRWYKAQKREQRYDWRVLTTKDLGDLSEFDSSEHLPD